MKAIAETDIMRPVARHFQAMDGFDVYPEVRIPRYSRRVDLVADDGLTLIAVEGKAQLDDVVIEQARQLQGISDATYVAVPEQLSPTDIFQMRMAHCVENNIGVMLIRGALLGPIFDPKIRNLNADPGILRDCLRDGQKDFAEAGSKAKEWTAEVEWFAKFENALQVGPIRTGHVERIVGPSPFGSTRKAITAIKKAIREGRVAARLDGVEFVTQD